MSESPSITPPTKQLIYLAAKNLLAHHAAGRKCDPHGLEWARWIVAHNAPKAPEQQEPA